IEATACREPLRGGRRGAPSRLRRAAIHFEADDARCLVAAAEAEAHAASRSGTRDAVGGHHERDLAPRALDADLRARSFGPRTVGAARFERAEHDARPSFTLEGERDRDVGVVRIRDVYGDLRIGLEGERAVVLHL